MRHLRGERALTPAARRGARRPSAAGHGGQDDEHVALPDRRVEAVEHADVLVVEVDVDVAVELAVGAEDLVLGLGVRVGQGVQDLADVGAVGRDLALAADGRRAGRAGCGSWP